MSNHPVLIAVCDPTDKKISYSIILRWVCVFLLLLAVIFIIPFLLNESESPLLSNESSLHGFEVSSNDSDIPLTLPIQVLPVMTKLLECSKPLGLPWPSHKISNRNLLIDLFETRCMARNPPLSSQVILSNTTVSLIPTTVNHGKPLDFLNIEENQGILIRWNRINKVFSKFSVYATGVIFTISIILYICIFARNIEQKNNYMLNAPGNLQKSICEDPLNNIVFAEAIAWFNILERMHKTAVKMEFNEAVVVLNQNSITSYLEGVLYDINQTMISLQQRCSLLEENYYQLREEKRILMTPVHSSEEKNLNKLTKNSSVYPELPLPNQLGRNWSQDLVDFQHPSPSIDNFFRSSENKFEGNHMDRREVDFNQGKSLVHSYNDRDARCVISPSPNHNNLGNSIPSPNQLSSLLNNPNEAIDSAHDDSFESYLKNMVHRECEETLSLKKDLEVLSSNLIRRHIDLKGNSIGIKENVFLKISPKFYPT